MTMNPFQQAGAFSWCELMTTDVQGAKSFYSQLFSWDMKDGPVQGVDYTVISAGGHEIGGLMACPEHGGQTMPPSWGTYVTVADVDATVQTAEALGGKRLVGPQDIPEVGRFALIKDPQGAVLSVISYNQPTG
jgi:uncharacterized protein